MSSRSHSRGREQIVSTGRGGAGNFLRSPSREAKLGVDESVGGGERGRTASPGGKITSSGRGGSGNIRAPSQTPADRIRAEQEEELEDRLIHERRGREIATDAPYSTGRGGAGNIGGSGSRSRSRSALGRTGTRSSQATDKTASTVVGSGHPIAREQTREGPLKHMITGGRGGWGNIAEEKPLTEDERKDVLARQEADQTIIEEHRAQEVDQPHSSGKGGFGNIHKDGANGQVDLSELSLEEKAARERYHANDKDPVMSTGKGGAGNIFHTHTHPTPWDKHEDQAADGDRRGRDLKTHSNGVIHNVLRSISRAGRSDKEKSTERGK